MRLAEKTIELNYCAQLGAELKRRILWFGLTQKQEARAGYDAYAQLGGQLLALQFKASNYVLRSGERRFHAPHHQLCALRRLGATRRNSVFYVFPGIGNTLELSRNPNLVAQSQLLDAGTIPAAIGAPTSRSGSLRRNGIHYVDVRAGVATFHSDPVEVRLTRLRQLLEGPLHVPVGEANVDRIERGLNWDEELHWFGNLLEVASGASIGAVILPRAV